MRRVGATIAAGLALLLAVSQPVLGQRGRRVQVVPTVGLNFATWTGSDVGSGATRRTGIHAGLMLRGDLSRLFALESGLLYSQEGTGADLGNGITGTFKVDYVRLPLLLRLKTELSGSSVRPYFLTGPALGVKIGCKVAASDNTTSVSVNCDDPNLNLNLTGADIGWAFGAGVDIGRITVGGRYQLGLKSIDDTGNTTADVKNSLLSITAGYSF